MSPPFRANWENQITRDEMRRFGAQNMRSGLGSTTSDQGFVINIPFCDWIPAQWRRDFLDNLQKNEGFRLFLMAVENVTRAFLGTFTLGMTSFLPPILPFLEAILDDCKIDAKEMQKIACQMEKDFVTVAKMFRDIYARMKETLVWASTALAAGSTAVASTTTAAAGIATAVAGAAGGAAVAGAAAAAAPVLGVTAAVAGALIWALPLYAELCDVLALVPHYLCLGRWPSPDELMAALGEIGDVCLALLAVPGIQDAAVGIGNVVGATFGNAEGGKEVAQFLLKTGADAKRAEDNYKKIRSGKLKLASLKREEREAVLLFDATKYGIRRKMLVDAYQDYVESGCKDAAIRSAIVRQEVSLGINLQPLAGTNEPRIERPTCLQQQIQAAQKMAPNVSANLNNLRGGLFSAQSQSQRVTALKRKYQSPPPITAAALVAQVNPQKLIFAHSTGTQGLSTGRAIANIGISALLGAAAATSIKQKPEYGAVVGAIAGVLLNRRG